MPVTGRSDTVWPSRDDYQTSVLDPARFLKDQRLHSARVETRRLGALMVPFPRSGNFGAVYKLIAPRHTYALKIFDKSQPDRQQRYQLIDRHLRAQAGAPSGPLVSFSYDPEGILVNGRRYPTLVMEWVEGQLLDAYLSESLQTGGRVDNAALCRAWVQLVEELQTRHIAHGDLQHGNILVMPDGTFKLVDYDGMFVPAMRQCGLTAAEIGLPAYQHPKRYRGYFDERLDDFSALVILLTLATVDADLWRTYHTDDNCLLVPERDLVQPGQSRLLNELSRSPDAPIKKLAAMLRAAAKGSLQNIPRFDGVTSDASVCQLLSSSWQRSAQNAETQRVSPPTRSGSCSQCSAGLQAGDRFCRMCGTPVGGAKKTPKPPKVKTRRVDVVVRVDPPPPPPPRPKPPPRYQWEIPSPEALALTGQKLAAAGFTPASPALTPGDELVLSYLAAGASDEDVARRLSVELEDTRAYLDQIQDKVGVITRKDLIIWAMTHGIKGTPLKPAVQVGLIRGFAGHTHMVRSVAFSPSGKLILSASPDGTLRLWDVDQGTEVRRFEGHGGWFSPNDVNSGVFSADGRWILSGGRDGTARLWNAETGQELRRFKGHQDAISNVAISSDGRQALTGSRDHTVRLWDVESAQQQKCMNGHTANVMSVTFAPDGRHVLSGGADKIMRLWSIETGLEVRRFTGHTGIVGGVAFSPDGRTIASASSDRSVRLWDPSTAVEIRRFDGHTDEVVGVAFSPDGRRMLSAGLDQTIRLWEVSSGRSLHRFYFTKNGEPFWSVAFSPDGSLAVSGNGGVHSPDGWTPSNDNQVRLWRLPS